MCASPFQSSIAQSGDQKKKKRHSLVECRIENLLGVGDKRRKREESRKAEKVPKRRPTAGSGS